MKNNRKIIEKKRKEDLNRFQKKIKLHFRNIELLDKAFSHKSYVNEADNSIENNEKLEFLGDAFLGFIISEYIYNQNIYLTEGSLAKIKSYVVSEKTLYKIGKEINIQEYILIGKGEEKSGGRYRKALIGDCVEALIGAYYLDSGFKAAKKFVEKLFSKEIINVEENKHEKDYKSILQEFSQKKYKIVPRYIVLKTEGPDHKKSYFVDVDIKGKIYGPGVGKSKKQAEQNVARITLNSLSLLKELKDSIIEEKNDKVKKRKGKGFVIRRNRRTRNSNKDAKT